MCEVFRKYIFIHMLATFSSYLSFPIFTESSLQYNSVQNWFMFQDYTYRANTNSFESVNYLKLATLLYKSFDCSFHCPKNEVTRHSAKLVASGWLAILDQTCFLSLTFQDHRH